LEDEKPGFSEKPGFFPRTIEMIQRGEGSLGYVADVVGISERVLLKESRQRGMLPHYDDRFIEQDLNQ
jgi:predicted HTH domain antitoxin